MKLNATNLFENSEPRVSLAPCSESFWTSVFALFLLQGTQRDPTGFAIPVFVQNSAFERPPWYKRRTREPDFKPGKIRFADLVVEPTKEQAYKYLTMVNGDSSFPAFGVRPDIMLRHASKTRMLTLIECKTTTDSKLQANQVQNYCEIVEQLTRSGVEAEVFLLMSSGSTSLDKQISHLEHRLGSSFGLLLWEEVFSKMAEMQFSVSGLEIVDWQKYSELDDSERDLLA